MEDLAQVKIKLNQMAELSLSMLRRTFEGFMQHDLDILAAVLKDEHKLNETERSLTLSLIGISKIQNSAQDKKNITCLTNIIGDLEEVGDYVKDMIERIEIKIREKLLFSEEALAEYKHLYEVVETALSDIVKSLNMSDLNFAKRAMADEEHVDNLIEKYRDAHAQRLMSGVCDPRAGNMFLNLLDFTAQIFRHTKSIAKSVLELK